MCREWEFAHTLCTYVADRVPRTPNRSRGVPLSSLFPPPSPFPPFPPPSPFSDFRFVRPPA